MGKKMGTPSDYPIWQDREGAVSGLNLGPPSTGGSRAIQAEVATSCGRDVEIRCVEQVIPERFQ